MFYRAYYLLIQIIISDKSMPLGATELFYLSLPKQLCGIWLAGRCNNHKTTTSFPTLYRKGFSLSKH